MPGSRGCQRCDRRGVARHSAADRDRLGPGTGGAWRPCPTGCEPPIRIASPCVPTAAWPPGSTWTATVAWRRARRAGLRALCRAWRHGDLVAVADRRGCGAGFLGPCCGRTLPGALLPEVDGKPFPSPQALAVQRLSSVGHWDVPVLLGAGKRLHLLAFAAGPPVFDGPEDRNGKRNHDEVAFWSLYLDGRLDADATGRAGRSCLGSPTSIRRTARDCGTRSPG